MRAAVAFLAVLSAVSLRLPAETASAANPVIYPGTPPAEPVRGAGAGISVTATVFLVACAGAGAWLWWRGRRGTPISGLRTERKLAIAETRPLGSRQYLVVASYEGRKFMLGVCPGRIDMLTPLDETTVPRKA